MLGLFCIPIPSHPDATHLILPEITGTRCRTLAALLVAWAVCTPASAREAIPLPRPRPVELGPATVPLPPLRPTIPAVPEVVVPPPPSECQLGLPDIAAIEVLAPITGASGCGIEDAVRLSAVMAK